MMREVPPPVFLDHRPGVGLVPATDEALLVALAREEQAALGLLYDRYGALTYGLAYRILQDGGAAEEVVQDVFLQVWRHAASFRPGRGSVRTWLLSIAHHRAIDSMRGKVGQARNARSLDDVAPPDVPRYDPWEAIDWRMLGEQLRGAFARLSPVQRQAVELAYFGYLTAPEIAERQGVPLGTVKGRLRLGLQTLRDELGQLADSVAHVPATQASLAHPIAHPLEGTNTPYRAAAPD